MKKFESHNEDDWNEKEVFQWKEADWKQYLHKVDHEISRFLALYQKLKEAPDRLDQVAHLIGWEEGGSDRNDETALGPFHLSSMEDDDDTESEDLEFYTLHRHPLFIVTQGLYQDLRRLWEQFIRQEGAVVSPLFTWDLASSFNAGETHAILAIQALDLEDYPLVICHLKHALAAINRVLYIIQNVQPYTGDRIRTLQRESTLRLFDLREVWLRTMNDCREAMRQGSNEGDNKEGA